MKNLSKILISISLLMIFSCSKEENIADNISNQNPEITTSGMDFVPKTLNCNVGDTIEFKLGPNHNAVEVSADVYNIPNGTTPLENGFNIGYGESTYIIVTEAKTHYYVCQPHVPGMKGIIIVE